MGCPLRVNKSQTNVIPSTPKLTQLWGPISTHTHTIRTSVPQGASGDIFHRCIFERQWIERHRDHGPFDMIDRGNGIDVATLWPFTYAALSIRALRT